MNDPIRILVVDDDPDILSGTARLLEQAGYTVDKASSGEDALQAVQVHRPDLLLLDRSLPGINGVEVCRRIKLDPALADSLVVVVSASHAESDDQAEGLESGADGYIGRPIANRELLARVESYVRILRLTDSLRRRAEELKNSNDAVTQAHLASLNLMEDAVAARDRAEQANQELRREIAERKRVEEALGESQRRLGIALEASQTGEWELDLRNQKARRSLLHDRIFGYDTLLASWTAEMFVEHVLAEDRPDVVRRLGEAMTTHADWNFECRIRRAGGDVRWIRVAGRQEYNSAGEPVRMMGTVQDITDRKQAEAEKEELAAVNRQLHKSESLGRMAGAIAHRFNNQLQVVAGNLELALGGLSRGRDVLDHLTEALRATRGASEVSALMLTYLGQAVTTRAPLDLAEVCRPGAPLLKAAVPNDVLLTFEWPSPGPVVRVNANQVQQVLANLVTNAWEAMDSAGGAIHVTVTTVAPADIASSRRFPVDWQPAAQAYACLEVADTGCGIAATEIDKLFDPFFSSKFAGRGMGLSVVLGIVRAHDGVITVESESGRGSIFRVYVPLTAEPAAHIPRPPKHVAAAPDVHGGGTVLVVDDEDMVRNVAAAMLADLGFTVLKAKDGVEAVEVFQQHADDIRCVLCDLTMPRMNGWATLTALRRLAPGIPVILASGYSEAQVMEGEHPELPQACLSKPYGREELREALRQALADDKQR